MLAGEKKDWTSKVALVVELEVLVCSGGSAGGR